MTKNLAWAAEAPCAPLLVTPREAARMLSISARTLWTLRKQGRIRSIRIGAAVRYAVADLEAFVAGHHPPAAGTTPDAATDNNVSFND